jgi:carbamate kinase
VRYRDLKEERDAAIARAIEAERLSMKSEVDRITAEFEQEKVRLLAQVSENTKESYLRGFNAGIDAMAGDIKTCLEHRTALRPITLGRNVAWTHDVIRENDAARAQKDLEG